MHSKPMKLFAMTAMCVLLQAGCGGGSDDSPPRAAVQGTVLLDDKPLPQGIIRFVPQDETGGPKISANIEAGAFSLPEEHGPWVGSHRIEIESTDNGGYAIDDEQAIQKLKAQGVRKIERIQVPADYNRRSTLNAVIVEGQVNELEYLLTSSSKQR